MLLKIQTSTPLRTSFAIDVRFDSSLLGRKGDGINEETIRTYAECGVDFISSGALTHSVYNMDLSLKAI